MADFKSALNNVNAKDYKINSLSSNNNISDNGTSQSNDTYEEIDYSNPTVSPQTNNIDTSKMPDYSQSDIVKNVDKEIENLEKQIKDLEKQIKDKEKNMSNVFENVWRAVFFQDESEQDKKIKEEIEKLEKQKSELENQISELKTLKTYYVNTLKEDFYLNIPNNSDFEEKTNLTLTEEEAHQVITMYIALNGKISHLASVNYEKYSSFMTEEKYMDYDTVKKLFEEHEIDAPSSENTDWNNLDWDIIKSAYDKGFNNIFEVAMQDPKLLEVYLNNDTGVWNGGNLPYVEYGYYLGNAAHDLNYMTEEERKTALYIYNTSGFDAFKQYIDFKEDELNNREGLAKALEFIETIDPSDPNFTDYVETHIKGLGDGVDNFWEGIDNALGGMDGKVSVEQYETMYIMYYLQDNKGLTIDYELSSAIGNMLPSMAASAIVSLAATPAAGTLVGSTLMGVSAGGNAAEMAYQEGHSYWESVFYGTLSGASESVLSYFLGGIPFLSKIDDIPGVKGYLLNVLKEGGEEALQSILDPQLKNLALGTNETVDWEEVAKSGVYGMIIAGYLNGGQLAVEGTNIAVQKLEEAVMIAEELGIDPNKYKNPLALLNDPDIKNYKKMASKLKNIDYKKENLKSYNLNSPNNLETLKDVNQDFKGKDFLGGDQESFYNAYTKKFKNQILKQEIIELENIIKKHKPEYTNQEILELATKVKETGCSSVDVANNIFEQLNYDSEKFSSLFGFSMFKSNGSLNHNALILDIVSFFEDKVEVKVKGTYKTNTYDSNITAANQILGTNFSDNTEAFIALTNNNVRIDGNTYTYFEKNPSNYIGDYKDISKQLGLDVDSLEDFQTQLKQKNIVASVESADIPSKLTTLNIKNHDKWMNLYFNYKNIDLAFTTNELHFKDYDSLVTEIESNIKNGNSISVGVRPSSEVSMTDGTKFGWFNFGNFNNAGHVMSFRGINDNGDIVVSSWGKYYTIPKVYASSLEFKSRKLKSVLDYSSTENIDFNTTNSFSKIDDSVENINQEINKLNYNKHKPSEYVIEYLKSNIRKFAYKNTNAIDGLNKQIIDNGLYHFTDAADNILESGFIKASGFSDSYGNRKTFFFNGVPEVGAYATNLDKLPIKTTAVRVQPTNDLVNSSKIKLRYIDDMAITYDGKFNLSNYEAEKCFFVLTTENGELKYQQVSEAIYNNYETTNSGKLLSQYVSNKKNIVDIKSDFLTKISNNNGMDTNLSNIDIFEIDEQLLESPNLFSKKYKFKMDLKSVPKDYRKGYKDFFLNISSSIKMNKELGENLEKIFDTENYVIGIHKSGMANPNSILENGLFLTGHSSSGIGSFDGLLDLNIVFEQPSGFRDADFLRFCDSIKGSAGYKTTTGNGNAIIVKIPKSDFNDINKLTYFDGQYNLKPEYIVGYVKTVSNSSGNVKFEDIIYNSKYIDSNYKILTDFKRVFNDGNSDTKLINLISEQFENSIKSGNKDAAITLNKLVELKMVDPTLKLKMALPSKKHAVSYYQHSTKSINIMPDSLKKESLTCYHELFHMLDYAYSYKQGIYKAPNDYELIFDKARDHLLKNGNKLLNEFVYKYQNIWKYQRNEANKLFSKKIEQLGFENFDSYRNNLIFQYNDMLNSMDDDRIIKYIESLEIGRYIQPGKVDGAILADAEIAATFNSLKKEALSNLKNTSSSISDIADALLKGNVYNDLRMSGHGKKYYARQYSDFKEIIAQFGALKIGAPERLEDIKYFFGEDFYNYMEEAYKLRVREKENIWK